MSKVILLFFIQIILFHSFFGQSVLYSTVNKKAIKYYEKAIVCFNNISVETGKPDIEGTENLLIKSLAKDSTFWEAYSLLSNLNIEKGDIKSAIFLEKK